MTTNFAVTSKSADSGWVNRLFNAQAPSPEYQELKFALHRKLLERINLEVLSALGGERVRGEIRAAVAKLLEEESTPLSRLERNASPKRSSMRSSVWDRSSPCCRTPRSRTSW